MKATLRESSENGTGAATGTTGKFDTASYDDVFKENRIKMRITSE